MLKGQPRLKSRAFLILLASLSIGCVPTPHQVHYAPKIHGVLMKGGQPLSNTNVYLGLSIHNDVCNQYDHVSTTNDKGEFEIGPISESQYFVWLVAYGDPYVSWDLCSEGPDGNKTAILHQGGIGYSVEELTVECDILNSDYLYIDAFPTIHGKCESDH